MATVVITFFLITQVYVCKMDADCRERRRNISEREKRWSMNSQRLEEIVAELMKPIRDARRSFDTDLSALLEEYLTGAGLHALDAEGEEFNTVIPNFTEVALLLQQSASIYSRKVDFLYQHVLNVSNSLHNSTQEQEGGAAEVEATPTARRKRKASTHAFAPLELEAGAGVGGSAGAGGRPVRPPPTLPRVYVELEPRVLGERDFPLLDYAGEPVGLLADFHVTWRLHEGQLVEELVEGCDSGTTQRALPLCELQAALLAAAPPSPPPPATPPPPSPPPPALDFSPDRAAADPAVADPTSANPVTTDPAPGDVATTDPATGDPATADPATADPATDESALADPTSPDHVVPRRKRRGDLISNVEDIAEGVKNFRISQEGRARLSRQQEFGVPRRWRRRVVGARRAELRALRRRLRRRRSAGDLRGFRLAGPKDVGGFAGWSPQEVSEAAAAARAGAEAAAKAGAGAGGDSDDDGFFELSSLGSDRSRVDDAPAATAHTTCQECPAALPSESQEQVAWRERVPERAGAGAGGDDVLRACAALLQAAPPPPAAAPFPALLAAARARAEDVSMYFLATLFLANAGNVEIVQGAPLEMNAFSLRVLSTDESLYRRAMD